MSPKASPDLLAWGSPACPRSSLSSLFQRRCSPPGGTGRLLQPLRTQEDTPQPSAHRRAPHNPQNTGGHPTALSTQEGVGPTPGHTTTKLQSWTETHIQSLANRHRGRAWLSGWREGTGDPRPQGEVPDCRWGRYCGSFSPEGRSEMFSYCKIDVETPKHAENAWV